MAASTIRPGLIVFAALTLVLGVVVAVAYWPGPDEAPGDRDAVVRSGGAAAPEPATAPPVSAPGASAAQDAMSAEDTARPGWSAAGASDEPAGTAGSADPTPAANDLGAAAPPPVGFDPDHPLAAAQLADVRAAAQNGERERLSSHGAPEPFDAAAYADDPLAYLTRVDARRVWQIDDAAARITPASPLAGQLRPGESTTLKVQTDPGAPATFVSKGLGAFRNGLSIISVRADEEGIAAVRYLATPGTIGPVTILAASPLRSGQVVFRYTVSTTAH